jgi:hypothetical protein
MSQPVRPETNGGVPADELLASELASPALYSLYRLRARIGQVAHRAAEPRTGSIIIVNQTGAEESFHAEAISWLKEIHQLIEQALSESP